MKNRIIALCYLLSAICLSAFAQGTAFTYQGRLNNGGGPASGSYDLTFSLFNLGSGGVAIAGPVTNSAVEVTNGLFTTQVDFGSVLNGATNWLEIAVSTNGANSFTTLAPRQQITPTPYAITAAYLSSVVENNSIQGGVSSATIGGGYQNIISTAGINCTISGGSVNTVISPNSTIGGGEYNTTGTNSYFATISGGGYSSIGTNSSSTTISGGYANAIDDNTLDSAIGGGSFNTIGTNSPYSTIAGGRINSISGNAIASAIGGGFENTVRGGNYHVIGGGCLNLAGPSGIYATNSSYGSVGGGYGNNAEGNYATAPGGYLNWALGQYSFAAGRQAKAMSDGTFIWADSQNAEFDSSGTNQFDVRASGGVQFVTSGAGMTLDGQAVLTSSSLSNVALRTGGNAFSGQQTVTGGSVGIGTTAPSAALHVRGADGAQFTLQNSADNSSWYFSDDVNDNLVFQPNTGVGAYISRDGNYHVNSDERLKRDIIPLGGVLDRVLQLRPVSYRFRSAPEGTPLTLGLIAQEVEPLFPEVVGERGGKKSMAYSELIPVTIRAVQELDQKMDSENAALREELKHRDAENAALKQRLDALEVFVRKQKSN